MHVFTHALASLAAARVVIPRPPRTSWVVVVIAGTIPDLDALSASGGPSAYLTWHHTDSHSLVMALVVATMLTAAFVLLTLKSPSLRISPAVLFAAAALSAGLHLALDASTWQGAALFWPFGSRRIAADWLAVVDPWVIAILVGALVLPELLRLVSTEIGAKDKSPRGRTGAIIGLAGVLLYIGVRATLHSNVMAAMQARTYRNELPRRAAAYPESASLFSWHGIVETDRALHELIVNAAPGAFFDPESNITLFKPESSPVLDRARDSAAAKAFLRVAQFPKATVEKTSAGYEVQIRDLRYAAAGEVRHEIVAVVRTDASGNVAGDELVWASDLRRH